MPLPNPTYLTQEYFYWNGFQAPAVQLTTSAAATGSKRLIRWDGLDSFDRARIHDLLTGYNDRLATPEAEADIVSAFAPGKAYHVVNYGGTVAGGNNAGLEDGITYTASVVHNGVEVPISIAGSSTATFTDVITAIGVDLAAQAGSTDASVAINSDGNIEFTSSAVGAGQIIEAYDQNLFRSMNGFVGFDEIRVGVTTVEDVFDLNIRDNSNEQTYSELLTGHLRTITNKAPRAARTVDDVYFNHGTATWLLVYTDAAPV